MNFAVGNGEKNYENTPKPLAATTATANYQEVDIPFNDIAIITTNETKNSEQTNEDENLYNKLAFSQVNKK